MGKPLRLIDFALAKHPKWKKRQRDTLVTDANSFLESLVLEHDVDELLAILLKHGFVGKNYKSNAERILEAAGERKEKRLRNGRRKKSQD